MRSTTSQLKLCSEYPLSVVVPVVWHSFVPPRPLVTCRVIDPSLAPLCPGSRNTVIPAIAADADADGGPPDGSGFHVNYSSPPLNAAQAGPAVRFAQIMRDQLVAAGLQPSTYRGTDGLYGRADLAGLNLAQYPSILIETGNMKNAGEAAVMEHPDGRARYAAAVVSGIAAYLQ